MTAFVPHQLLLVLGFPKADAEADERKVRCLVQDAVDASAVTTRLCTLSNALLTYFSNTSLPSAYSSHFLCIYVC